MPAAVKKTWHYYRELWRPPRVKAKDRWPPSSSLKDLDAALERIGKLEPGSAAGVHLYADLVRQCGNARSPDQAARLHHHIVEHGYMSSAFLSELVLQMQARCGRLELAKAMFDALPQRRAFAWNVLIEGYNRVGRARDALNTYHQMSVDNVRPNAATLVAALAACGSLRDVDEGSAVYERVRWCCRPPGVDVLTAVVTMYGRCGRVELGRRVFDAMEQRDVVAWNAMMAAYAQNGQAEEALALFWQMCSEASGYVENGQGRELQSGGKEQVEPDGISFATAIAACASIDQVRAVHSALRPSASSKATAVAASNALVAAYARCQSCDEAWAVFQATGDRRDVVLWTSMMTAFVHSGRSGDAVKLFERMCAEGVQVDATALTTAATACAAAGDVAAGRSIHACAAAAGLLPGDVVLANAVISMYDRFGDADEARAVFDAVPYADRTVVSWTAMIAACSRCGRPGDALALYRDLTATPLRPNAVTFLAVIPACAALGDRELPRRVHAAASELCHGDVQVSNALIDMYSKCGDVAAARATFEAMSQRDVITWTSMIAAYVSSGGGGEAMSLYESMVHSGMPADAVTFVAVLGACSAMGCLDKGRWLHSQIAAAGLDQEPLLQNALLHMYSKCGSIDVARREFFDQLSSRGTVAWTSMMAAYAQEGYCDETVELYSRMSCEGVLPNEVSFIPVLVACGHGGRLDEARQCFHSVSVDFGLTPLVEHFDCMVDALGRAGRLPEAEELIKSMPFEPDGIAWQTLLAARKLHGSGADASLGRVAQNAWELEPGKPASYWLLSQICSFC